MAYSKILRRLRDEKTNYKRRTALLKSKRDFVTVKISNENIQVQLHKPEILGDKVIASAHSRFLIKKGWTGSRKNIPAAYLTGYFAGKKAIQKGGKDAILYRGTDKYTTRMAAALKGIVDAGLKIPASPEAFPAEERLKGQHLKVKNDVDKVKATIDSEVKV
ncbi:MAG TPA: 50S ribosomal protein L18 [Nitrosopumilaceae archaeon]|nr:50S ribosomal protein L18 [Nitrosopumilaceae archaeon]